MLGCGLYLCFLNTNLKKIPLTLVVQALVQARKAGIASAMAARSSIKDEELVNLTLNISLLSLWINNISSTRKIIISKFIALTMPQCISTNKCSPFCRKTMCTRRPYRLSSTLYPALHHITLRSGLPLHPHTAMSVRGYCGELPAKACVAPNVGSNAMRSARSC